ncbi:unnamed protein product [Spodoptera littoralis]|uniref:AB hydrolase-1 domain-containing protein n=1 Tax=Spodoptera littoralis TaxID=7109 RepID=A0A9P0IB84_SPOLI|nr:unnamed protein product [Spodoptera littoralis]CAH1642104.1 unnamed protein product [Spodoptera littoralis]
MKFQHEWRIQVPWGQLALISRGHPDGEPVFLVHGRQDSSSIFTPLINMMTDQYYYVALDMPGNGLSDAFPKAASEKEDPDHLRYAVYFDTPPKPSEPFVDFCRNRMLTYKNKNPRSGPKLMRFHFLYAMELAIAHLGWEKFIFMGHSMGCEQGLFYNAIYPDRITKMILLDAGPTLMRMQIEDPAEFQRIYYDTYYDNYHHENFETKLYTRNTATEALKRLRDLNDPQCAFLLQRNFHEIDDRSWHQLEEWHSGEMVRRRQEQARLQDGASSSNDARNPLEGRSESQSPVLEFESDSDDGSAVQKMRNPGPPLTTSQLVEQYMRQYKLRFSGELGTLNGDNPERLRVTRDVPKSTTCPDGTPALDLSQIIKHMREHDPVGYLSWDNRLKNLAPQNYGNDYYFELFKTIPPSLFVVASDGMKSAPKNPIWRERAMELIDRLSKLNNFNRVDVEGSHDVHFTHPERVAPHVIKFLKDKVNSKL